MKKRFCLALALILSLTLSACGGTSAESETPSGSLVSSKAPTSEAPSTPTPTSTPASNHITFEEEIVVDNEECTIKVTGIDAGNMWGYTLNTYLENKSADKTYMFSVTSAAVDGVQCDPFWATEVAPGKKSNSQISFMDSTLKDNGITDYTDIELSFRVYDSDDWMADNVAEETVHIYPYGMEQAARFTRQSQPSDTVIMDNESVTVTVIGYNEDTIWGYAVNLFLENKSDKELMFSVNDASVNGYMADPFYATSLLPGKCAFSSMTWFDSTLEENSITEVEEIEFALRVYDSNNWMADDVANQVITLHP